MCLSLKEPRHKIKSSLPVSNTLPPNSRSNGTAVYWDWPGPISTILIWDQPHGIWVSELEYAACAVNISRAVCEVDVLTRLQHVVEATATFMASFLSYSTIDHKYHVGPPVAGAAEKGQAGQESAQQISDPTFELTQFAVTLTVANKWRVRLGKPKNNTWAEMVQKLAPAPLTTIPPPVSSKGAYLVAVGKACQAAGHTVRFDKGQLRTGENLCLDIAHRDPDRHWILLPTACTSSQTQQRIHSTNSSEQVTNFHFESSTGDCLVVLEADRYTRVGVWSCDEDITSRQRWDLNISTGSVLISQKGEVSTLCMAQRTPPDPFQSPQMIYNQNAVSAPLHTITHTTSLVRSSPTLYSAPIYSS